MIKSGGEGYLGPAECHAPMIRFNLIGAILKSLWKHWQSFAK
jgi:hypothetical protein